MVVRSLFCGCRGPCETLLSPRLPTETRDGGVVLDCADLWTRECGAPARATWLAATSSKTSISRATWRSNDCSRPSRVAWSDIARAGRVVGHVVEGSDQLAEGVGAGDDVAFAAVGHQLAGAVAGGRDHRAGRRPGPRRRRASRGRSRSAGRRSRSTSSRRGCRGGSRGGGPSRPGPGAGPSAERAASPPPQTSRWIGRPLDSRRRRSAGPGAAASSPLSQKLWPTNRPTRSPGSRPSRLRKAQRTAPGWARRARPASIALGITWIRWRGTWWYCWRCP